MKEKIKTIFLLFLIGLSISMTGKIWMQSPEEVIQLVRKDTKTKEEDKETYPLIDMLSPSKYLLNFSSQTHSLQYDDTNHNMWHLAMNPLTELFKSKGLILKEIKESEYAEYQDRESVTFSFGEKTNTYSLARALGVRRPNEIVNTIPKVREIYIYLGGKDSFFVFEGDTKYYEIDAKDIDLTELVNQIRRIEEENNYVHYYSMRQTHGIDNNIFIPYEVNHSMPDVFVTNMVLKMSKQDKDKLAETFLDTSIDYINEVVEGNNNSIYLYGQEVLKINTSGLIEYFRPLEETVAERNLYQSLRTVSNFLSNRARLDKDMFLARVEEIENEDNQGYRLEFRYKIRGIPVVMGNLDIGEYLEIEVFNNYIRSYKHYNRKDKIKFNNSLQEEERSILPAFEAIDKNYNLLSKLYLKSKGEVNLEDKKKDELVNDILSSIEDITLAYYDPCLQEVEEKLIAIWAIRFEDRLIAFDAYTGNLVYQKEL